jgi:hypothetical protein
LTPKIKPRALSFANKNPAFLPPISVKSTRHFYPSFLAGYGIHFWYPFLVPMVSIIGIYGIHFWGSFLGV